VFLHQTGVWLKRPFLVVPATAARAARNLQVLSSFSFASFQLARLDRAGLPVFTAPAGRLLGLIDWEGRACVAAPRICPPGARAKM